MGNGLSLRRWFPQIARSYQDGRGLPILGATASDDTSTASDGSTTDVPVIAGAGLGGAIALIGLLALFKRGRKNEDDQRHRIHRLPPAGTPLS